MKTFLLKTSLIITFLAIFYNYTFAQTEIEIKYTITGKTVSFQHSSNITPEAYLWDFGNGETSTIKNPTHTYKEYRKYKITLNLIIDGKTSKSATTELLINKEIKLSGTIFMGDNLLPDGYVLLINLNKSSYSTNASTQIDQGKFTFNNIENGRYTILAIPELNYGEFYFPKYIPTYYGNSFNWENFSEIDPTNTDLIYKINLISYQEPYYGKNSLKGEIIFDKQEDDIMQNHTIVILLNSQKQPIDFQIVDAYNTKYFFTNLPAGQYYIHIEKPGLSTNDHPVYITSEQTQQDMYNFIIGENTIEYQDNSQSEQIEITPHLKNLKVSVPLNNQTLICELFDTAGRKVLQTTKNSDEFYINTQNITGGLYFLKIKTFNNHNIRISKIFIEN